jgi:hypothetical protein
MHVIWCKSNSVLRLNRGFFKCNERLDVLTLSLYSHVSVHMLYLDV